MLGGRRWWWQKVVWRKFWNRWKKITRIVCLFIANLALPSPHPVAAALFASILLEEGTGGQVWVNGSVFAPLVTCLAFRLFA
ncbi:hypothetical protein K440DRAFT_630449 [Wilcoxina mikolae CBS 423.85]|nr:hypothetical protein K440DRAFT_630449 [Wilcoxina mikolae CBS 423.85]